MLEFIEFNPDQNRLLADASNQYDQWLSAKRTDTQYAGIWMTFRDKNGTDYLTSGHSNGVNQKSHGARSPETERQLIEFNEGKAQSKVMLEAIQARLAERAPQLKAVRLGRILAPLAQVIREFDVQGMVGPSLIVAGTHAITAYEALAGHFFDSALTATEDLDFVWHRSGKGAELIVKPGESTALLKHLKTVDTSYTVNTERTFQVRNAKGLVIDFISDEAGAANAPKEYLKPIAIKGQEWLTGADTVSVVAIDTNGLPVKLVVPDPRVFALHKAWVSERPDRNPLKKSKDMNQAIAVASLVKRFLPQYPFDDVFITNLSSELKVSFEQHIESVIAHIDNNSGPTM